MLWSAGTKQEAEPKCKEPPPLFFCLSSGPSVSLVVLPGFKRLATVESHGCSAALCWLYEESALCVPLARWNNEYRPKDGGK